MYHRSLNNRSGLGHAILAAAGGLTSTRQAERIAAERAKPPAPAQPVDKPKG